MWMWVKNKKLDMYSMYSLFIQFDSNWLWAFLWFNLCGYTGLFNLSGAEYHFSRQREGQPE